MDKSESELLEEWDVVTVSSVYETEKESEEKESTDTDTKNNVDTNAMNVTAKIDNGGTPELESSTIPQNERNTVIELESKTERNMETKPESNIEAESESNIEAEPESNIEVESQSNVEVQHEKDVIAIEPENIAITAEPRSCTETQPEKIAETETENSVITQIENTTAELKDDPDVDSKINTDIYAGKITIDIENNTEAAEQSTDDNFVEDIVHVDRSVNNNLDSSMMTFDTESCEESYIQDAPELVPERMKIELEMASIESSSSDIDIIDENVEESITSSFICPSSLSISSSVADTSSMHSFTSQSEESKECKPEQKDDMKKRESTEKKETPCATIPQISYHGDNGENIRDRRRESQRTTTNRRSLFEWIFLLIEFIRNMSGYDWCVVGGVALSLYFTVIIHQTNIFAIVEKENVVSQMKDMIDELRHDNKMLQKQMLSETKNEKVLSSFEHQIRELRKENSKLNHMLYDVAKVLDKQKNSQEKKEAEYLAPFKNEINKLKEHINILKFDNEELQRQLVRMRYASYSQGSPESKDQARKEGTQAEEDASTEDIPMDIESLKKWNELISVLTKELGTLSGTEGFKDDEKSHSDTQNKQSKPFWKAFLNDFKGTFNDLRKINFSAIFSDYKKANQKAVSDIYKFVKDFFTVEENAQQYTSGEDGSQWKNIGDFVNDLKEKWTNIKDRLYTSDLKQFFEKSFKKDGDKPSHGDYYSQKAKDAAFEHTESKTTNTHFESEKKSDKVQMPEDTKWMFKRAAHREALRDTEEEVNWFLKKGRYNSEDEKEERHL